MDREHVITLIGFALRTGRYVVGLTGARVAARRRRSGVVLLAAEIGSRKEEAIRRWAGALSVDVFRGLEAGELGRLTGRERCEVLYVYDRELARALRIALGAGGQIC